MSGTWFTAIQLVRSRDGQGSPDILLQGWIAPGEGPQKLQSYFRNGPFAQQMLIPLELENATQIHSEAIDPALLCWMTTLLVPFGGFRAADVKAGETVVVGGATGHFGSAAVAVALAMGARRVIALGRNRASLDVLVNIFGNRVTGVVLTGRPNVDERNTKEAGDNRVDCVLDILPPISDPSPVVAAAMSVRAGGRVVLMGGVDADVYLPYKPIMRNSIRVYGQYMYDSRAPQLLAGLISSGQLPLDPFHVDRYPLEDIAEAVRHAGDTGGAFHLTVVLPNE